MRLAETTRRSDRRVRVKRSDWIRMATSRVRKERWVRRKV